jgi:hypothetical protein
MPSIPREVIEHHLAMCPQAHPVKQKTRKQAQEKQDFTVQEIEKLKKAKLIREVAHPTWIANPVVVPKANMAMGTSAWTLQVSTRLVPRILICSQG